MALKLVLLLAMVAYCKCVYIYSSFWAPLFDPRILNYRVDSTFDQDAGKSYREEYVRNYGIRGEELISDLGNGKGPANVPLSKNLQPVQFHYTYPGADGDNAINYNDI